jgi:pre-mRNA-splicing factor SYF1
MSSLGSLREEDIPYEEDVLRNPYSLKSWLRYLDWKQDSPARERNLLYERALKELPGSYKLWRAYLQERMAQVRNRAITHPSYEAVNRVFERALVFMHKMPRIWLDYVAFLALQRFVTRTRRVFDRALRALPVAQHQRIWDEYLKWVRAVRVPRMAVRVYRRYLKLEPTRVEEYIAFLLEEGEWREAAHQLARVLDSPELTRDAAGQAPGEKWRALYMQLAELVARHPVEVRELRLPVEGILRGGIARFPEDSGRLWTALADHFIRAGHFEKARDIFEEALQAVLTVKDFTQVYDAYLQFEDSLLAARLENQQQQQQQEEEEGEALRTELLMARYDALIERRALLLSSVLLRQNPHNVREWLKRVRLFEREEDIVATYSAALRTVDPMQAKGKPHLLWVHYARFYEAHGDVDGARRILERAVQARFRTAEELAAVYLAWAEMELRLGEGGRARAVLQRALAVPSRKAAQAIASDAQRSLHRVPRLWAAAADLEESLVGLEAARLVYERAIELRVATPALCLSFARALEAERYFEDAFRVYERATQLFPFPAPGALEIWLVYLTRFIRRYGGRKLERARDLFEHCLEKVPAKDAKIIFLLYAQLEEEHGLARHAMAVYERACRQVAPEDRLAMYLLYVGRAAEFFGVTRTREIFEQGIEALPDEQSRALCLRYAELERRLGEIDRARALFLHAAQTADPRRAANFWQAWHEFEVAHGSEDTFREMLRVRRSVEAHFNTQVNVMSTAMLAAAKSMGLQETAAAAAKAALAVVAKPAGPPTGHEEPLRPPEDSREKDLERLVRHAEDATQIQLPEPGENQELTPLKAVEERKRPRPADDEEFQVEQKELPGFLRAAAAAQQPPPAKEAAPKQQPIGALERLKRKK